MAAYTICPCWGVGGVLLGHVARVITYETRTPSRGATSTSGTHRSPHPSSPCRRICLCRNRVCLGYYIGPRAGAESGGCRGRKRVPIVTYTSVALRCMRCVRCVEIDMYRSQRTHRLRCVARVAYRTQRTHRLRCIRCVGCVRFVTFVAF